MTWVKFKKTFHNILITDLQAAQTCSFYKKFSDWVPLSRDVWDDEWLVAAVTTFSSEFIIQFCSQAGQHSLSCQTWSQSSKKLSEKNYSQQIAMEED